MESGYFDSTGYYTYDIAGNPTLWPATFQPNGPTIAEAPAKLMQPVLTEVTWLAGVTTRQLVPIKLSGDIEFDSETEKDDYIAAWLVAAATAVRLTRLNKEGDFHLGGSIWAVPIESAPRKANVTLLLYPKGLPRLLPSGVVCLW